jgi:hypothetical protein
VRHEVGIDRREREPARFDAAASSAPVARSAHDDHVGAPSVGRIRFHPRIAERDVRRFGDHVVAEVARGVLEKARAPVAFGQVKPVALHGAAVAQLEVRGVPAGRPAGILQPEVEAAHVGQRHVHLVGEAVDQPGALHVPAEQAQGEGDALAHQRVLAPQQLHRLDEAGHPDHGVASRHAPDLAQHCESSTG